MLNLITSILGLTCLMANKLYRFALFFALPVAILLSILCVATTSSESYAEDVSGAHQHSGNLQAQYAWVETEGIGTSLTLEDIRATATWSADDERWETLAAKVGKGYNLEKAYYHGAIYSRIDSPSVMLESHPGYVKLAVGWRSSADQRMARRKGLPLKDSWQTDKGLKRGDSFKRMQEVYGIPTSSPNHDVISRQNRLSRVDYEYVRDDGNKYRLSFYFRGGKVDYVEKWWERAGLDWANLKRGDLAPR